MVHDPVEQGHDKYNSFLSSMFILRADGNDTRILILLLYFNKNLKNAKLYSIEFLRTEMTSDISN